MVRVKKTPTKNQLAALRRLDDGPAQPMKYSRNWQICPSYSNWKPPKHTVSTRILKSLLVSELACMVFRVDSHTHVYVVRKEQVEPEDKIIPAEKWPQYHIH